MVSKLAEWIETNGENYSSFARRVTAVLRNPEIVGAGADPRDVKPDTIRRLCLPADHKDHRKPGPKLKVAIYYVTSGAVQPNDFYDLPVLRPSTRAQDEEAQGEAPREEEEAA